MAASMPKHMVGTLAPASHGKYPTTPRLQSKLIKATGASMGEPTSNPIPYFSLVHFNTSFGLRFIMYLRFPPDGYGNEIEAMFYLLTIKV